MMRFITFCIITLAILIADNLFDLSRLRHDLSFIQEPVYKASNFPQAVEKWWNNNFTVDAYSLRKENTSLKSEVFILKNQLHQLNLLKTENHQLRLLLKAPLPTNQKIMAAEVIGYGGIYKQKLLINRGSRHGAYVSQVVLSDKGIIGQVSQVGLFSSWVLALNDINHAIPVVNQRTVLTAIAKGTGQHNNILLSYTDLDSYQLQLGDVFVSSGFGQVFPEGYPVGKVSAISNNSNSKSLTVVLTTFVDFNRVKYVLLATPVVSSYPGVIRE